MSSIDVVMLQCGLSDLTVRCIESVRATSDARIILVDNGSHLIDFVAACRALNDDVDLVIANDSNLGFAKAVNQGIRASDADYVVIQNNDTVMQTPGDYDRLAAWLELDSALGCVGPLTNAAESEQRVEGPGAVGDGYFTTGGLVAFFCTMFPRRVIDEVGLLSEDYGLGYGEDNDYCIRLRQAGYKLGIARDVYVHHDHHATYTQTIGREGIDAEGAQGVELLLERYGRVA